MNEKSKNFPWPIWDKKRKISANFLDFTAELCWFLIMMRNRSLTKSNFNIQSQNSPTYSKYFEIFLPAGNHNAECVVTWWNRDMNNFHALKRKKIAFLSRFGFPNGSASDIGATRLNLRICDEFLEVFCWINSISIFPPPTQVTH